MAFQFHDDEGIANIKNTQTVPVSGEKRADPLTVEFIHCYGI